MGEPDSNEFLQMLRADGVVKDAGAALTPLSGGVSSEIYKVTDGSETFVVKRALPKLRVESEWLADVNRNHFEQLYLNYVAGVLPGVTPAVRMASKEHGYFAMEYFGPEFSNWKDLLMQKQIDSSHAKMAGHILGRIHKHSAGDAEAAKNFDTTANFHQLRVDPYFISMLEKQPTVRKVVEAEVTRLEASRMCLVHGDFSPKNILIAGKRMVVLDCEVAWYGDPAFDAAFLLTHLFLKALYFTRREMGFDRMIYAFWNAYINAVGDAFNTAELEAHTVRLLLLLMLARIDGKSPVEYITLREHKQLVRNFVKNKLSDKRQKITLISAAWFALLTEFQGY